MKSIIQNLIEQIIPICDNWTQKGDDGLDRFIDPNDGKEASAHYGATHAAASFILWGKVIGDETLYNRGISLLYSILRRWDESKCLPAFHFDFNNFALCLVEDFVNEEVKDVIHKTVCNTADSNHDTINWLPMRWVVNRKRVEWTNERKYETEIVRCKRIIKKAINADGGVEDRLPHGLSFNLQYDLATIAVLQYLNVLGEHIDLSKELGFLLNAIAPDGDINYQGRGTNQIFAWGLWVYLLASSSQTDALRVALGYLSPRLPKMLEHNNLMLNEWEGFEKYLWWDYHHTSVYTAHCLVWLILAYLDYGKHSITPVPPTYTETGLHIYRSDNFFVSWFAGRIEYLAERGPVISVIWSKTQGMICKGAFGPWLGAFGNKYTCKQSVLYNFCGLLRIETPKDLSQNRYLRHLLTKWKQNPQLTIEPVLMSICVFEDIEGLHIRFENREKESLVFNLPIVAGMPKKVVLDVDGIRIKLSANSYIRNQYGWCRLLQSKAYKGKVWTLTIPLKDNK